MPPYKQFQIPFRVTAIMQRVCYMKKLTLHPDPYVKCSEASGGNAARQCRYRKTFLRGLRGTAIVYITGSLSFPFWNPEGCLIIALLESRGISRVPIISFLESTVIPI